jgi:hypothetical protein
MSILFWRKTLETGTPGNPDTVPANEDNPLPVQIVDLDDNDPARVKIDMAYLPPVAGQTITRQVKVTGIGTGAAYAAGDTFGGLIRIPDVFRAEKRSGTIVGLLFHDFDDEGIGKTALFFRRAITGGTDNDAYAIADSDNLAFVGKIAITDFEDLANSYVGQNTSERIWVQGESTDLWCQFKTTGADNIAAGAEPWISVTVIPD